MNFNLLDKLAAVEIKADNRISEADRRFCEIHQQAYHEAKDALQKIHDQWESISERQTELLSPIEEDRYCLNKYIRISSIDASDFIKKIEALPETFINKLVSYFNSTYKVSIKEFLITGNLLPTKPDSGIWDPEHKAETAYHEKLRSMKLTYKDVLDQIFIQLGGQSFTDRALDEIKERCHSAAWDSYHGTPEYELKKDTIRFTGYFCNYENWYSHEKWSLCDGMKNILRGLAFFETSIISSYPQNIACLLGYDDKEYSIFSFNDCSKLEQLKMFKNHRVDVKFASKELAEQFVSEYLGRVC